MGPPGGGAGAAAAGGAGLPEPTDQEVADIQRAGGVGRGLHSFTFQVNFSCSVPQVTQLDPLMFPQCAQVELKGERV